MAYELRHSDVGTALSKSEWEEVGTHVFNGQVAGDILYALTTSQLSKLGIGSANQLLATNAGATAPEWVSSVALATLATTFTSTANDSTSETVYPVFVDGQAGAQGAETDVGLTYNPSSGIITSTGYAGTLQTAAQGLVTSLGTLTALQVDFANLNASTLTITDSTDTGDYASLAVTTHGATTLATVDDDATAAHLTLDVDGNIELNADGGTITFADAGSSLGTITTSGYSGNAATATVLATQRAINGVDFNGSAPITITAAGSTLSDTVTVAKGGTGATSLTADSVLTGNSTTAIVAEANLTFASDVLTLTSSSASLPRIDITNTHDLTTSGEIRFNKNSTGDDGDIMGKISWFGTDSGDNAHEQLAYIDATITDSAPGSEAASMRFYVAENNATNTLGLQLAGQADDSGEIDVTIAAGAASNTTIAGILTMGSTAAMTNAGLLSVGNQSGITGLGTITSGTWTSGTAVIASAYLDADTAHLSGSQTFNGAKTFTADVTVGVDDTGQDVQFFGASAGAYAKWVEASNLLELRGATAAGPGHLKLTTGELTVANTDVLGRIDFNAPLEADGADGDARLISASIEAVAQATFSDTVNSTDLIFKTGHSETATEKFRFTSQGEIGIGGANYGTDGQVLTSAGGGVAVAWEDAGGGGGTITIEADGNIAAGAPVYLTSEGFAKEVKGAWDYPRESTYPRDLYYGIDATSPVTLHYDDNASKMVSPVRYSNYKLTPVAFNTTAGTGNLTGIINMDVAPSSGDNTSITSVDIGSDIGSCYDEDQNATVIIGQVAGGVNKLKGYASTISGTTWTLGTLSDAAEIDGVEVNTSYIGCAYDKGSNKVIAVGRATNNDLYCYCGTVDSSASPPTLVWGNGVEIADDSTAYAPNVVYATNITKCVVVYMDYGNNQNMRSVNITVSGTTPNGGTPQTIKSSMCEGVRGDSNAIAYDENASKIVAFFGYNTSTSGEGGGWDYSAAGHSTFTYAVAIGTPSTTTTAWNVADMYAGHSDTMGHASAGARQSVDYFGLDADFNGNNTSLRFHPFKFDGSMSICYIPDAQKMLCVFCPPDSAFPNWETQGDNDPTSMYSMLGTISGTSISFTSPELIYSGSIGMGISVGYDPSQDRALISFQDKSPDKIVIIPGAWESGVVEDFNVGHLDQYLGLATAGVSDGADVTITVPGGLNENQSSLVIGSTYYLAPTGEIHNTLGRHWKGHRITVGQAITTSSMLVGSEGYGKNIKGIGRY